MPKFTIVTLERYAHASTYEVEAETVEEAIRMIKANEVDYESTSIESDGDDEFIEVMDIEDENGRSLEAPKDPEPNCTRMTFEIVTCEIWDEAAVTAVAEEFQNRYTSYIGIDSACLDVYENVYVEPYVDEGHDDDDED